MNLKCTGTGCEVRRLTQVAQQAEPVAAQCRFEGEEDWKPCTVAHHLLVQAHPKEWPHYETRALYDKPPAVDGLLAKLEEAEHHRDCLARAIRNAAVKAGIIRADATAEGPQMLMLAYNLGEAAMLAAAPKPAQQPADDVIKDAERYRWLRDRMLGVDLDWCESGVTALAFEMPDGCAYGGDCDQNIDAAIAAHKAQEGKA